MEKAIPGYCGAYSLIPSHITAVTRVNGIGLLGCVSPILSCGVAFDTQKNVTASISPTIQTKIEGRVLTIFFSLKKVCLQYPNPRFFQVKTLLSLTKSGVSIKSRIKKTTILHRRVRPWSTGCVQGIWAISPFMDEQRSKESYDTPK
jgi:hypothetical protein